MSAFHLPVVRPQAPNWNKGRIIGRKPPLPSKQVWAIRVCLEIADNIRDHALLNMAINCKLYRRDLVGLMARGVLVYGDMKQRASVIGRKAQRPVQFEITEQTLKSVQRWTESSAMFGCDDPWSSHFHDRMGSFATELSRPHMLQGSFL
jgi:site-specific recombinase XerC